MKLDPWQKEFIETKGDKILNTGRQVGKSEICGIDAGLFAVKNKNKNILMIAPTERQSYALFEKTLSYIANNNPKMISKGKDRPTKTKITLINGTKIYCLPTGLSGMGIRFLTVHRLYADEASRIAEEVWAAVTPMLLTTGGDLILLSTPAGKQGYFYDCWINKDGAFDSFARFQTNSEKVMKERAICKTWTKEQRSSALTQLERERARMTVLQYAQEYMGLFLDELRQFYPSDLINKVCCLKRQPFYPSFNYHLGMDIARMGEDESTFEIIDKINKRKLKHVESILTRKTLTTETTRKAIVLNQKYDFRGILLDDGGMGVGVYDQLLENESTRRKIKSTGSMSRPLTRDEKKRKTVVKEDMHNNLLKLMEMGQIELLDDEEIKQSLRSIQYEYQKNGKIKIWGTYAHITDGIIRAAYSTKTKRLNIWIA